MRLRNIYVLCSENKQKIELIKGSSATNNGYTIVSGWDNFLDALKQIKPVDFLNEDISNLISCVPEIYRHQKQFHVTNSEWNKINQRKNNLLASMENVIKLYESMGLLTEEQIGLDIKLPKCDSFSDFKKCIDELEFILYKCPFFRIEGEDLKFHSLDVGSMWLNFVVIGVAIGVSSKLLKNLVTFLDKCLILRSHKITIDQQAVQLQTMKIEQKEKKELLKGINKIYQAQADDIISELEKNTGIQLQDGEEKGVVLQTFEKMNLLIDKGLQIYSTIDSPKEIQTLFQPIEQKYLSIYDEIKLLEKRDSE